jgi:MEMO1 family protein
VPSVTHYATPLGEVPLDRDFIGQLEKHNLFQTIPPVHQHEHSVQIELPLLQFGLGDDFHLVPVVVGQLDNKTIEETAAVLKSLIDEETLVVASSDFTHYGPNFQHVPFRENIPENLKELDMGAYEFITKRDIAGFLNYCREKGNHICGNIPIAILLGMLPAGVRVNLIQYDTSGNITGDFINSVSYLTAAFTGGSWLVK